MRKFNLRWPNKNYQPSKPKILAVLAGSVAVTLILWSLWGVWKANQDQQLRNRLNELALLSNETQQSFVDNSLDQSNLLFMQLLATLEDRPEKAQLEIEIKRKTELLGQYLEEGYGSAKRNEYQEMWNDYQKILVEYAQVRRSGEQQAMEKLLPKVTGYPQRLADFFQKENPAVKDTFRMAFSDYFALTKSVVDAAAVKDYQEVIEKRDEMNKQMKKIAKVVSYRAKE